MFERLRYDMICWAQWLRNILLGRMLHASSETFALNPIKRFKEETALLEQRPALLEAQTRVRHAMGGRLEDFI